MNQLLLIVTIAGQRVAFPAAAVESVVELDTLIPVPRAAPHVAGLSALRSRVLTVIDCMRSLELGMSDCSDGIREAAVVELEGHHYALIVDVVEDVVEALSDPSPVRAAITAAKAPFFDKGRFCGLYFARVKYTNDYLYFKTPAVG